MLFAASLASFASLAVAVEEHKYCIVGAGPAGLQLGHFLKHQNRDYLIFERNARPGSFFEHYPRHRRLISLNKRNVRENRSADFAFRHDWNTLIDVREEAQRPAPVTARSKELFPHASVLTDYLREFAMEQEQQIRYGSLVQKVRRAKSSQAFEVQVLQSGAAEDFLCGELILASGLARARAGENTVDGSELLLGYEDMPESGESFEGKAVVVLGQGNAALETVQESLRLPIAALEARDARRLGAVLRGPEGSPFEGHDFELELHFGDEYPFRPPAVRFTSPRRIFHPNICRGTGGICLDIFNDATLWSPAIGLEKLLMSVASLLSEPREEHGLNEEAVAMLRSDPAAFADAAKTAAALPRGSQPQVEARAECRAAEGNPIQPVQQKELKDGSSLCGLVVLVLALAIGYAELQKYTSEVHLLSRPRDLPQGGKGVRFAFETHYVGDIRAGRTTILDTYLLKSLDTFDFDALPAKHRLALVPCAGRLCVFDVEEGDCADQHCKRNFALGGQNLSYTVPIATWC
ncbi:unnamed protein product [Effrenium voratum]|nr:unnamed protein product [Effrenium voratum]